MIRTRGLVKRYGAFTAVSGIDLNIPAGQIYGFLGPNGSGKTSTILMLLGILRPDAGEIWLFDERYTAERLDLRRRIGVVPEKHPHGMWRWMTAAEYLMMFARLFAVPQAEERMRRLLQRVDLYEVRDKRFSAFSHGMMQKLSIVRALLHDPDILFLDEPISGLDPIGVKQVRDLILEENREGRTIFISSHMLSEMEKICHRVAIIFRGQLLAEDSMNVLLSRLARDREIHVDLEAVPAGLPERLRALPFVLGCSQRESSLRITVAKEGDFRRPVSEFLIREGLVPLRIQEKTLSLEEAFVTITQENVERLAAGGASGGAA